MVDCIKCSTEIEGDEEHIMTLIENAVHVSFDLDQSCLSAAVPSVCRLGVIIEAMLVEVL